MSAPELYAHSDSRSTFLTMHTEMDSQHQGSFVSEIRETRYDKRKNIGRSPIIIFKPSRQAFLGYVYVMFGCQVLISSLHWIYFTYHWHPTMNSFERGFYLLLLLLSWLNLTMGFFGFRRLQISFPFNWIIVGCMFEGLTLFVIFLCLLEQDLTWLIICVAMLMQLIYVPLGFWVPDQLPENIWILILMSISIVISSIIALTTDLSLHIYIPMIIIMMLFGPWTIYNVQCLHMVANDDFSRFKYLEFGAKMYMTYGCSIAGLIVAIRFADYMESESCKHTVFCQRNSVSIVQRS